MSKNRTRTIDALNLLLKERRSTVPLLEGASERSAKGPPLEPLEKLHDLLNSIPSFGLFLITYLVDRQRYEDATGWWPGAKDYLERVARLMGLLPGSLKEHAGFLAQLPFGPDDLLYRLGRIKLMEIVVERVESLGAQLRSTLLVERADVIRMGDMVMAEVEMLLGRPTVTGNARSTLAELAEIPLKMWSEWQGSIQQTKGKNEQLRTERQAEIDKANRSAEAARVVARIATGQKVGDEALTADPEPPPAPRRRTRR